MGIWTRCRMFSFPGDQRVIPGMALFGCWIAGSLLAQIPARLAAGTCPDAVGALAGHGLTFPGMLVTALIPLCVTACAVMIFGPRACFGCALLLGAGFGFALGTVCAAWPTGGCLMAFLLLFTRLWTNPGMLLYWLRRLEHGNRFFAPDTALCFGWCLAVGLVDYGIIAPFLADAIS